MSAKIGSEVQFTDEELSNFGGKTAKEVLVSQLQPKVTTPQYNKVVHIVKKVKDKEIKCDIVFDKDWFYAGETAKLQVNVDNSDCEHACNLEITHKANIAYVPSTKGKQNKYVDESFKTEKYFIAYKNASASKVIQLHLPGTVPDDMGLYMVG